MISSRQLYLVTQVGGSRQVPLFICTYGQSPAGRRSVSLSSDRVATVGRLNGRHLASRRVGRDLRPLCLFTLAHLPELSRLAARQVAGAN